MVSGLARCSFALRPAGSLTRFRAFCTKGFEHFIASMLASAATGWSVSCRVGLFTLPLEFCAFPRRTQTGSKMLMARDFHCGLKSAVYARTVYLRRVVEREGVSKCLTVRYLMSPGGCREATLHAAAFSRLCHIEPSSGWVGYRRGEETAPCMGRLRRLPPEGGVPGSREETALCLAARGGEAGARAGLASAGCSADAPASGQAVGSRLARTKLALGRGR